MAPPRAALAWVALLVGVAVRAETRDEPRRIAPGPFAATWESLSKGYQAPDWFRDAKFGIWAHWTAQCVPEQGDWYARLMYIQGTPDYAYQVAHYGHPSKVGFMELDHLWTAEHWDPEKLMALYKRAGAKYFVALASHHDNFDAFDSKYHAWNSVKVGPHKDIVGTWAKVARAAGLRFGVTNHSAHAWHWFQTAYGYDGEGPLEGVRYDAYRLTKADGKGTWWEGLDPQALYTGPNIVIPDGIHGAQAVAAWHDHHDRIWTELPPPNNPAFVDNWFLRCQDLVDSYHPDLLYFDDNELPLGQAGLDIAAHYYNANLRWSGGSLNAVLTAKYIQPIHERAVVKDLERGVATGILPYSWQTDTCIGDWHYRRSTYVEHHYKTVTQVVAMLADIVSKNGNLLLNVPLRGDGTIDEDEFAFLEGMARWMNVNAEGIFGTRPWTVYGEGPSVDEPAEKGSFEGASDLRSKPFTAQDMRFTTKAGALYAILLAWPTDHAVVVKSLAAGSLLTGGRRVSAVRLLGYEGRLEWSQEAEGLRVRLPDAAPSDHAVTLKIEGALPE